MVDYFFESVCYSCWNNFVVYIEKGNGSPSFQWVTWSSCFWYELLYFPDAKIVLFLVNNIIKRLNAGTFLAVSRNIWKSLQKIHYSRCFTFFMFRKAVVNSWSVNFLSKETFSHSAKKFVRLLLMKFTSGSMSSELEYFAWNASVKSDKISCCFVIILSWHCMYWIDFLVAFLFSNDKKYLELFSPSSCHCVLDLTINPSIYGFQCFSSWRRKFQFCSEPNCRLFNPRTDWGKGPVVNFRQ